MCYIKRILALLLALLILLGCRARPAATATPLTDVKPLLTATARAGTPLPQLVSSWKVSMTQSGGIMGMERKVVISSSGEMTLADLRSKKSRQTRLPGASLTTLSGLVASASYTPEVTPSGCADCFIFDLEITSAGQEFQARLDQVSLAGSGLESLVNYLAELLKEPVE